MAVLERKHVDGIPVMLTPEEVAKIMQVSEKTVQRWFRDGELNATKIGSVWRMHPLDVPFVDEVVPFPDSNSKEQSA